VALEIPNSLPLKNWLGIMNVLFAAFVTNLWLEKDLFKKRVALFAQSVLEKKCWKKWRLKIRNKKFRISFLKNDKFLEAILYYFSSTSAQQNYNSSLNYIYYTY